MATRLHDLDLVWVFSFDLGRPCDPEEVADRLVKSGVVHGKLSFDKSGRAIVACQDALTNRTSAESSAGSSPDREMDVLQIMGEEDSTLFYQEFLAGRRYLRLCLRGFDVSFQGFQTEIPESSKAEVYLLIHSSGFAILTIWVLLRRISLEMTDLVGVLASRDLAVICRLWPHLPEEHAKLVPAEREALTRVRSDSNGLISITTNIENIGKLYMLFVQAKGVLGEIQSIEQLNTSLRYPPAGVYPIVIMRNIGGHNLLHFIGRHRLELHGILAKERFWDWVDKRWVDDALRHNLSWRNDWAVFIGPSVSMMLLAPSVRGRFVRIWGKTPQSDLGQLLEMQYRQIDMDLVNLVEGLCLQSIMLRTYDFMLSTRSLSSTLELLDLRASLSRGLDEYYDVRVRPHLTAREWTRYGQEVMGINKLHDSVRDRFLLLESNLRARYETRVDQLLIFLTALFGATQVWQLAGFFGLPASLCVIVSLLILASVLIVARIMKVV